MPLSRVEIEPPFLSEGRFFGVVAVAVAAVRGFSVGNERRVVLRAASAVGDADEENADRDNKWTPRAESFYIEPLVFPRSMIDNTENQRMMSMP